MQTLLQDLRYGARMLLKKPGFSLIAVITLALGIGANTAIFSVVNAVLLRPLPYEQPDRLVALYDALPTLGYPRVGLSEAEFVRLRQENRSFAELAAWYWVPATLRGAPEPERVAAPFCTANFFRTLGVKVALGRDFNAEEEVVGKNNVVVLSHAFWRRKFAGDQAVIGRTLELDGDSVTVIGVLPASFKAPTELRADTRADMWRAFDLRPSNPRRGGQFMNVIGRLRPGATPAQAQAEQHANTRRDASENPKWYPPDILGYLLPLERAIVGDVRMALLVLLGAVAVVLLIACVNVANLLLVRGEDRQKEIAVRAALGASRGRIVRQLLMESLLLAAPGGGVGLLLAIWGVDALLAISPEDIPRLAETSLDLRVAGFALLISLLTAILFGLTPALRAAKFDLHTTLKEGGRSGAANSRSRLRRSLVVVETALAVVLLVAAGLLIRSVRELQRVEMGFRPDHLLTMRLTPPDSPYPDNQRVAGLYNRLLARIIALPGVVSPAVTDPFPPNRECNGRRDRGSPVRYEPVDEYERRFPHRQRRLFSDNGNAAVAGAVVYRRGPGRRAAGGCGQRNFCTRPLAGRRPRRKTLSLFERPAGSSDDAIPDYCRRSRRREEPRARRRRVAGSLHPAVAAHGHVWRRREGAATRFQLGRAHNGRSIEPGDCGAA